MKNIINKIKNPRLISWILFLFIIGTTYSKAENPEWVIYNDTNSVLPYNYIMSIAIDSNNNKWIGTQNGLAKIDNEGNWEVFNSENSGFPQNSIDAVAADSKNNVWIGFNSKGIAKFDNEKWTFFNKYNSGLSDQSIEDIAIDSKDNVWIGTLFGGLCKFDGVDNWTVYDTTNSIIPYRTVNCLAIDKEDNIWISTIGNLLRFDVNEEWKIFDLLDLINHTYVVITSLQIDNYNNIWVGNLGDVRTLMKNDTTWTYYTNKFVYGNIYALAFEKDNTLWIGSRAYEGGLIKFDGDTTFTRFSVDNSGLPNKSINSIKVDKDNNKWIGTFGGGVAVYKEGGVGVKENSNINSRFSIFPNPATDKLILKDIPEGANYYKIFNQLGIKIIEGKIENELNVSALPTGMYFLKIGNDKPLKFVKIE